MKKLNGNMGIVLPKILQNLGQKPYGKGGKTAQPQQPRLHMMHFGHHKVQIPVIPHHRLNQRQQRNAVAGKLHPVITPH